MQRAESIKPDVRRWPAWSRLRPEWPSWLMSLTLHLLVLLAFALTIRLAPRQGAGAERTAEVGIALKRQDGDREYYETESDAGADNAAADGAPAASLNELFSAESPVDPTPALPAAMNVIGRSALGGEGIPNAAGLTAGVAGRKGPVGGKARVSLFGLEGEGHKFVYVFDRSGSMGGSGRNALEAAKRELIASLESLESVHQFQIIFYNETPKVFNPSGQSGRLAFANEQNKERARRFIGSMTADGSTRHDLALSLALRFQPNVIFFLTDADKPGLSSGQLRDVQRRAGGITIHAVEFGLGPQRDAGNFLVKLARQNGGGHTYVDISKLVPAGTR